MKFKFFFFFFLASCSTYSLNSDRKSGYSSTGFAYINNNTSNKNEKNYFVSHNKLRSGTKIKITNPENKKFLDVIVKKKIKYDNFYKILISPSVANELNLSFEFPYVEINEIKSNKSFIAKKAITDKEEKKIANNAPIDKININNISKEIKVQKSKAKQLNQINNN